MKRLILLIFAGSVVLFGAIAVYYCLYDEWAIEERYEEINGKMNIQNVSSLLGGGSSIKVQVHLHFSDGKTEIRTAEAWRFTRANRPYFVIIGFGADGRVSFKQYGESVGKRFGFWVFNRRNEYFDNPRPLWIEVRSNEADGKVD